MLLSVIIYIINIIKSFLIIYYFITLELFKAFIFINKYIKKLFFYNSYRGSIIILRDFIVGLIVVIVARKKLTINKIKIKVAYKLAI